MAMWVKCDDRLPPGPGMYRVIRRAMSLRRQKDCLRFEPVGAEWKNGRGQRVRAVEEWYEEERTPEHAGQ